jgi:hypothetical protein
MRVTEGEEGVLDAIVAMKKKGVRSEMSMLR